MTWKARSGAGQDEGRVIQNGWLGYPVRGLPEDWQNGGFRVENMLNYADIWVWRDNELWFLEFNLG